MTALGYSSNGKRLDTGRRMEACCGGGNSPSNRTKRLRASLGTKNQPSEQPLKDEVGKKQGRPGVEQSRAEGGSSRTRSNRKHFGETALEPK